MSKLRVVDKAAPSIPEHITPPSGRIVKTYCIEVITPIYGGWAKTGKYDENNIIRAFSVRGNLRFWWRATRGAQFISRKKLFENESEIWGSVEKPSKVMVKVNCPYRDKKRKYKNEDKDKYGFSRNGEEHYVLFSALAETNKHDLVQEGSTNDRFIFEVTLSYDIVCEKDVECAIWAWVNFGGIGSRTRRGCGALYCEELAPEKTESINAWLKHNIDKDKYNLNLINVRNWSTLSNRIFIGIAQTDSFNAGKTGSTQTGSIKAWKKSIAPMKDFRQGERFGRDERSDNLKPAGRSRWPEPDTLRKLIPGEEEYSHLPRDFVPNGFPRAAFGLPISFKFINGDGPNGADEKGLKIKPEGLERMASPIILRPLKTGNGVLPMIVQLNSKLPSSIEISETEHKYSCQEIINAKFSKPEYTNSPMKGRTTSGDAVTAFLNFACEEHYSFKEVSI